MLDEAFISLARERVIPCPASHPYVRVGRDYYGSDVMNGPAFKQFEQTLRRLFPRHFEKPEQSQYSPEFPHMYALSLLEAAIVRLGTAGDPYIAASAPVEQVILELIDRLDSPTIELACARVVSHLTTADRSVLTIGPVTVLPTGRGESLGQIASIIPTAPAAFNRELPHHFSRPEALVAARTSVPNPYDMLTPATRTVDRFLLVIRLLYSATSTGIYEVTGETTKVCRYAARLRVLDYVEHPLCLRPAVLSEDSAGPIQAILTLYDTVIPPQTNKQLIQPLDMAFLKYGGTFSAKRWDENVVDLATALEASLSGTDKTDISLRVRTRAAALLATDDDDPSVIFEDLKILYDLRSRLVHGAAIPRKTMDGWLKDLSVAREDDMPNMQIERAVDRLRDLVRRAIIVRLLLAADGRWPLVGDPPPIDRILVDWKKSTQWREAWHAGLADMGAPAAIGPPAPLASSIFDDYPGKDD
ncbi:MAG: HEPN domain-containing protein [Actinomycetota bacterium]|nr:HEPN domain-containing protein [Actinomycetota bacterium]